MNIKKFNLSELKYEKNKLVHDTVSLAENVRKRGSA